MNYTEPEVIPNDTTRQAITELEDGKGKRFDSVEALIADLHDKAKTEGNSMSNFEEQRAEERTSLDNEQRAFKRVQAAVFAITKQFLPQGNGIPAISDMNELEAAQAELKAARAVTERITEEIRTGKRR